MNGMNDGELPIWDAEELPLGLGMRLAMDAEAMTAFAGLSLSEKSRMIAWIQSAPVGEEAQRRIEEAVEGLKGAGR